MSLLFYLTSLRCQFLDIELKYISISYHLVKKNGNLAGLKFC